MVTWITLWSLAFAGPPAPVIDRDALPAPRLQTRRDAGARDDAPRVAGWARA